jgi:phosphoribosylaminoimidazole carboxylase PurE protein
VVGIVLGSDSDLPVMREAAKVLDEFRVAHEIRVASAHRSPDKAAEYCRTALRRGLRVLIAGAGGAAHLPGVLAAGTTLPVIGVPIDSSPLAGLDALLAIAQMPGGVPVASMAIGRPGARNAALLAVAILALADPGLQRRLAAYRARLAADVEKKDRALQQQ